MELKFSEFLKEDMGAVSTGSIANARGSLFGSVMKRPSIKQPKIKTIKFKKVANWNGYTKLHEDDGTNKFSSQDVISKLNNAQKQNDLSKNAVVYGIEGQDGSVTKVYIDPSQDEEFKHALSHELRDADDKKDVAEILFNLRNNFNILHVEWPAIPEDEEANVEMDKNKEGQEGQEGLDGKAGDQPDDTMPPKDGDQVDDKDMPTDMETSGGGDDQSILFKVIDMLKADAEAKASEANARAKEAEAKEAGFAAQITGHKVKAEEEMAQADSYFKQQKDNKKSADKLSQLAKYRQEIAQQHGTNESIKSHKLIDEDVTQEVALLQSQLANLNVRKANATKAIDAQIGRIQRQLAIKTKQMGAIGTQPATPQATGATPQAIPNASNAPV